MNRPDFEELWERTRPESIGPGMESSLKLMAEAVWDAAIAYACEKVARETDALPERIAEIKQESHT